MAFQNIFQLILLCYVGYLYCTPIPVKSTIYTSMNNVVILTCKIPNGFTSIIWKYKSSIMDDYRTLWYEGLTELEREYSVSVSNGFNELTISNVKRNGTFMCYSNDLNRELVKYELIVIKTVFPLNDTMKLQCSNSNEINWYYKLIGTDNFIMLNVTNYMNNSTDKYMLDNSNLNQQDLIVQRTNLQDVGLYECRSKNDNQLISSYSTKIQFNVIMRGYDVNIF